MADESIEDGEFWLPPQFLEDDLVSDSSDLFSPMDSVAGSGVDWSDEEDYLAGLSLKMVRSALGDDSGNLDSEKYKGWSGNGSPKSILSSVGGCYRPQQRLSLATKQHEQPFGLNWTMVESDGGFFSDQPLCQRQFQATQMQRMRQHEMIQRLMLGQQYHHVVQGGPPLGLQWPPLQQQTNQKNQQIAHQIARPELMRAAYIGAPGTRPSTGTGVFLPRQVGRQPQPRKRQARSKVLVPPRMMQSLNTGFENMGSQPKQQLESRCGGRFSSETDGARRFTRNGCAEPARLVNHEIKLPQEWTY